MAYDATKLTRLKHLQSLADKVKDVTSALDSRVSSLERTPSSAYTLVKASDSGDYAAVYNLTRDGVPVGASINIPKDMVVQSGSVVTLSAGNGKGEGGADLASGTYIKLVLANADSSEIYIPADSLIEYVTSGSASGDMVVIAVSDDHKVTASISDGTVTKAKLHADVQAVLDRVVDASAATAGLMSAAHYSKLEGVSAQANKTTVTAEGSGAIEIDGVSKAVVNIATDAEVSEMISAIFS